jgi:hypothetical protein
VSVGEGCSKEKKKGEWETYNLKIYNPNNKSVAYCLSLSLSIYYYYFFILHGERDPLRVVASLGLPPNNKMRALSHIKTPISRSFDQLDVNMFKAVGTSVFSIHCACCICVFPLLACRAASVINWRPMPMKLSTARRRTD